jgi:hypothetical protein
MTDTITVTLGQDYTLESPTPYLRFVEREGKRILQQRWAVTTYDAMHVAKGVHGVWRDVPFALETDED